MTLIAFLCQLLPLHAMIFRWCRHWIDFHFSIAFFTPRGDGFRCWFRYFRFHEMPAISPDFAAISHAAASRRYFRRHCHITLPPLIIITIASRHAICHADFRWCFRWFHILLLLLMPPLLTPPIAAITPLLYARHYYQRLALSTLSLRHLRYFHIAGFLWLPQTAFSHHLFHFSWLYFLDFFAFRSHFPPRPFRFAAEMPPPAISLLAFMLLRLRFLIRWASPFHFLLSRRWYASSPLFAMLDYIIRFSFTPYFSLSFAFDIFADSIIRFFAFAAIFWLIAAFSSDYFSTRLAFFQRFLRYFHYYCAISSIFWLIENFQLIFFSFSSLHFHYFFAEAFAIIFIIIAFLHIADYILHFFFRIASSFLFRRIISSRAFMLFMTLLRFASFRCLLLECAAISPCWDSRCRRPPICLPPMPAPPRAPFLQPTPPPRLPPPAAGARMPLRRHYYAAWCRRAPAMKRPRCHWCCWCAAISHLIFDSAWLRAARLRLRLFSFCRHMLSFSISFLASSASSPRFCFFTSRLSIFSRFTLLHTLFWLMFHAIDHWFFAIDAADAISSFFFIIFDTADAPEWWWFRHAADADFRLW